MQQVLSSLGAQGSWWVLEQGRGGSLSPQPRCCPSSQPETGPRGSRCDEEAGCRGLDRVVCGRGHVNEHTRASVCQA